MTRYTPLFCVLLTLFAVPAAAPAVELPQPVGEWKLNEGRDAHIHDTSGNANHGMAKGINWVELAKGYGIEFDGDRAGVHCGTGPSLDLRKAISLEVWMAPTAPADYETGVAGKSFSSYGLTTYTDGRAYFYINSGGNKASTPVPLRQWSQVVGTFDGEKLRLFRNGKLADTSPSQFKTIKPGGPFYIGCIRKGALTRSFKGLVGAVRVYDRALDPDQVRALYDAQIKNYPRPPKRHEQLVVRTYPYLDQGLVLMDIDFSYLFPLEGEPKAWVELHRGSEISGDPIKKHSLPKLPHDGQMTDVEIPVGELAPGVYTLRIVFQADGKTVGESRTPLKRLGKIDVPSPKRWKAPALPEPPKPLDYRIELSDHGGLAIVTDTARIPVESTYSYPNGGTNTLGQDRSTDAKPDPTWDVTAEQTSSGRYRVTATGKHYTVDRRVTRETHRILVADTITNKTDDVIGILLSNHLRLPTSAGLAVTAPPNPSVFAYKPGLGVGVVALDDVYLEQYRTYRDGDRVGIRSDCFGLDAGASYTLEWAVYLNATGEYYDFVNAFRNDAGYRPHVAGGFAFTDRRESPDAEYVRRRKLAYASIGCLGHAADDPTLSLEGVEYIEYPKECNLLRKTFAETLRRFPDMKVMFHIAHSLYTTNKPKELFGDSRVLNSQGVQTDYGSQNPAYYRKYFSEDRVKQGYRWYIFYPTMDNSFGTYMLRAIDVMLEEIGANSMFADGFSHGYGGRFTYDRWDGHTVQIDPKTKTVVRKYASVNLLAQDVLVEVMRRVGAKGGVVIANSYPGTRTIHSEPNLLYCLETAGGGRVCARLHFTPSVIALGNPANCKTARDVYVDLRDKIEWGGLYFYYGEKEVPPDTIVTRMYPITVTDIGRGLIKGPERIITLHSGVTGWRDDRSLHGVHLYDGRGVLTSHEIVTTVDADGSRTPLTLKKMETAVIERLPATIASSRPVNVHVSGYDADGLSLVACPLGPARLIVESGALAIADDRSYLVCMGETCRQAKPESGRLVVDLPAGKRTKITIRPAD